MKNKVRIIVAVLLLVSSVIQAQDSEFKDTPWFSGMPNYKIVDATDLEFDSYNFFNGKNCTTIEGKKFFRTYTLKEEAKRSSDLQISRNYSAAVRSMRGTVLFEGVCEGGNCAENCGYQMMVGKVLKDNNEMWVEVVPFNDGGDYYLTILVKEAMNQDVMASDMFDALNRDGHIALYINFDTGKSIIRDESKPLIEQIVQMMKSNPELKIGVEGHTDNVGSPASNKTLSESRAKSVVSGIVSQGIAAERLIPAGHGQDNPIADNNTEEGRAKNRRVELVRK